MPTADPYTPTGLPDHPVGVFDCTVAQVGALVRTIEILGTAPGDRDPDPTVTTAEVERWITQLSGGLMSRLTGFARIAGDTKERLTTAGADAVANAAASYVEAAAYPEQAAPADTSYAEVLWNRWQLLADNLVDAVAATIDRGGPDVEADPRTGGLAATFPAPALPDGKAWW